MADEQTQTPEEDITAVEEMHNINADTLAMIEKYKRMAAGAMQQGDGITANFYSKVADDILPLLGDHVRSTGAFAAEVSEFMDEVDEAGLLPEGEEGEEGAEVEVGPDGAPALDDAHIVVEKMELEALYRFVHTMVAFMEVSYSNKLFVKKEKVKAVAESLLELLRQTAATGLSMHGYQPDEGAIKFRTELEAAFK